MGAAVIAAAIVAFLSPFNEAAFRKFLSLGINDVWPSRQAIDEKEWVDRLNGAQDNCTLLGIANGKWCTDKRFAPTLQYRLKCGIAFKMLFLDPNCAAADLRAQEEKGKRDTRDAIRDSIRIMWEFRELLAAGLKDRLRLYVYKATPSCGLAWIDKSMIVTHYLPGLPDVTSPALEVTPPQVGMERSLYNIYAQNLEKIIEVSSIELDDRNIQEFLPKQPPKREGGNHTPQKPDLIQPGGTNEETKGA